MPLYEYACPSCGHRFELRQSFSDPVINACLQCGAESRRVIGAPQVLYKGSGFYTSDKRRDGFGSYWYNRDAEADKSGKDPSDTNNSTPPSSLDAPR
jgi:putative FmdB family regulatory protein